MVDYSQPPICPGECIRCGRIARYWFCVGCTAEPRYVNRLPKSKVVRLPPSRDERERRAA